MRFTRACSKAGCWAAVALRGAVLVDQGARPPLRDAVTATKIGNGVSASRRAHHFPFCRSLSIEMSRAWSATICFEARVLLLEGLRRWASFSFMLAVSDPPAVEGLIGDPDPLAGLGDRQSLRLAALCLVIRAAVATLKHNVLDGLGSNAHV